LDEILEDFPSLKREQTVEAISEATAIIEKFGSPRGRSKLPGLCLKNVRRQAARLP